MRSIRLIIPFILLLTACQSNVVDDESIPKSSTGKPIYYAYAPRYSGGFQPGKTEYLKTVLDVWKEYETGNIIKTSKNFADSITLIFPDQKCSGRKDSILAMYKKRRDAFIYVQNHIDSWMPAYSKEHDEYWVFLWGKQDCTDKNGKFTALVLHESWKFNKEGKIIFMQEYWSGNR